jgi:hypothetical protein
MIKCADCVQNVTYGMWWFIILIEKSYNMSKRAVQHELSNKLYEVDSIAYWWFIIYIGLVKICNICEEV